MRLSVSDADVTPQLTELSAVLQSLILHNASRRKQSRRPIEGFKPPQHGSGQLHRHVRARGWPGRGSPTLVPSKQHIRSRPLLTLMQRDASDLYISTLPTCGSAAGECPSTVTLCCSTTQANTSPKSHELPGIKIHSRAVDSFKVPTQFRAYFEAATKQS
jgi:hypothetical protein